MSRPTSPLDRTALISSREMGEIILSAFSEKNDFAVEQSGSLGANLAMITFVST